MFRGTTPRLVFKTSIDARMFSELYMTFKQGGKIVLEKTKEECEIGVNKITVELSQEETLQFNTLSQVHVQIRAKIGEQALTHDPITVPIKAILKEGVI